MNYQIRKIRFKSFCLYWLWCQCKDLPCFWMARYTCHTKMSGKELKLCLGILYNRIYQPPYLGLISIICWPKLHSRHKQKNKNKDFIAFYRQRHYDSRGKIVVMQWKLSSLIYWQNFNIKKKLNANQKPM